MFKNHPRIDIKPDALDLLLIKVGWAILALQFILIASFYYQLPSTIATHFNAYGTPDRFGNKNTIWVLAIINLVVFYGMTVLMKKVKPWQMNYPLKLTEKNAAKAYSLCYRMLSTLSLGIAVLFFAISTETMLLAGNYIDASTPFLLPALTVFITLLPFYFMYKMFKIPK